MTVNKTETSLSSSLGEGGHHNSRSGHHGSSPRSATTEKRGSKASAAANTSASAATPSVALSANLQSFVNRLSTPKKGKESTDASSHHRASTPQPSSTLQTSSTAGDLASELGNAASGAAPNAVVTGIASSGISSAASSAVSIAKKVNNFRIYIKLGLILEQEKFQVFEKIPIQTLTISKKCLKFYIIKPKNISKYFSN